MTNDIDAALLAIDQASGGKGLFANLDDATRQAIAREVSWTHLPGGEVLFRCGDAGGAPFVVITGRLQAIIEVPGGPPEVVGEISQGEVVGEMSVLTGNPRSLTVRAIRDTTLIKFSLPAFERVAERNPLKDKTLPVVALLACRRLDAMVASMFGTVDIADLWRHYFSVSADLTNAELRIHRSGPLARATRASMSLPGIAIPVHDNGALLVDGGVLNNLPADVMKTVCGGPVVAVNVTPEKDLVVSGPYPAAISGWSLLLNRRHIKVPGILSIIMRTTMLASTRERNRVADDIDLLLNPAVDQFGMFDWDKLDAIAQAGYECARDALQRWNVA